MQFSATDYQQGLFWARFMFIGVIFIPIFIYDFIISFLNLKKDRKVYPYILAIGFIFFTINISTGLFVSEVYKYSWGYYAKTTLFQILCNIFFVITYIRCGIASFFSFYSKKDKISPGQYNRNRILFIAFVLGMIAGLDYIPTYGVNIRPFGYIFATVFIAIITYAIVKHQLLDIKVIIKKTLVYSILISILSTIYFIAVYLLERIFSSIAGYRSIPLTIFVIALLSSIFIPLKNKIQYMIDKYFFKGSIDQIEKEKELLETELQRSERLKSVSTLAAGMAHEIRNPLTSIKTFVEYMGKKHQDPEFRAKFENIVPKEIDKITNIINQLLDYSRTEKVSQKECDIHHILEYVLDLYNSAFLNKHIKLQKEYNSKFSRIICDENQLKQVFINIILNSIESMPSGGDITVMTEDIDNTLEITIKDTGIGIPKDKIKHLFDPFYTTKEKGTGLGLFIVHQIIQNNNGKIGIDSDASKGTVVKIKLCKSNKTL